GELGRRVFLWGGAAAESTLVVGLFLPVPAVAALRRKGTDRDLGLLWAGALAFYLVVFCGLANVRLDDPLHVYMQARFWPQALVVVWAFLGVGLAHAAAGLRPWGPRLGWGIAAGLPLAVATANVGEMRCEGNTLVRAYGDAILRSLPPDAILMISSDEAIGSVRYLQSVEGQGPGIRIVPLGIVTS